MREPLHDRKTANDPTCKNVRRKPNADRCAPASAPPKRPSEKCCRLSVADDESACGSPTCPTCSTAPAPAMECTERRCPSNHPQPEDVTTITSECGVLCSGKCAEPAYTCIRNKKYECDIGTGTPLCLQEFQETERRTEDLLDKFNYVDFSKYTFNKNKYLPSTYLPGDGSDFLQGYRSSHLASAMDENSILERLQVPLGPLPSYRDILGRGGSSLTQKMNGGKNRFVCDKNACTGANTYNGDAFGCRRGCNGIGFSTPWNGEFHSYTGRGPPSRSNRASCSCSDPSDPPLDKAARVSKEVSDPKDHLPGGRDNCCCSAVDDTAAAAAGGPQMDFCGAPDCKIATDLIGPPCGAPDCPYCPYSNGEPTAGDGCGCGAIECINKKKQKGCGAPDCKYRQKKKKRKAKRQRQGDYDSNKSCESAICPFAKMTDVDSLVCDNPECPFAKGNTKYDDNACPTVKELLICQDCGGVIVGEIDLTEQNRKELANAQEIATYPLITSFNADEQQKRKPSTDQPIVVSTKEMLEKILAEDKKTKKDPSKMADKYDFGKKKKKEMVSYTYPGVVLGHKYCLRRHRRNVPANMGWLWTKKPCYGNAELWRGYKPGAIFRPVYKIIRQHRHLLGLYDPSEIIKKKRSQRNADKNKRCITVLKNKGCYFVTVNPVKDPKTIDEYESPYLDCSPLQFKVIKDAAAEGGQRIEKVDNETCTCDEGIEELFNQDSDDSDFEFTFSPPAALPKPTQRKKKAIIDKNTQFEVPEKKGKRKGKGKKKQKKKENE